VKGTAVKPEKQPLLVSVAPVQKKKYAKKSAHTIRDDNDSMI